MRPATTPATRALGLGVAASFLLTLAGCGGPGAEDDAIVVPEPGTDLTAGPAPGAAPGAAAQAPATPATPGAPDAAPVEVAEGWGTLRGRVVFGGDPPDPPILVQQGENVQDAAVCSAEAIESERLVVDSETRGVQYALVYLARPSAVHPEVEAAASETEVIFDQEQCIFIPHVLGVMRGATINITSSDPVNHNVNARMPANGTFNQIFAPNQTQPLTLQAAERRPVQVTCDIHPWMRAWWMIHDNPYLAVTDEQGNFELANVPAGTQRVVVWQEAVDFVTPATGQEVTILADDEVEEEFTIDPGSVRPAR